MESLSKGGAVEICERSFQKGLQVEGRAGRVEDNLASC